MPGCGPMGRRLPKEEDRFFFSDKLGWERPLASMICTTERAGSPKSWLTSSHMSSVCMDDIGHSSSDVARVRHTTDGQGSQAVCSGRDSAAACTHSWFWVRAPFLFFCFLFFVIFRSCIFGFVAKIVLKKTESRLRREKNLRASSIVLLRD